MRNEKSITSWGNVAGWYDEYLRQPNTLQKELILPNLLRILGSLTSEGREAPVRVLDVACGLGFNAHAFAKAGADVVGVDVSIELIELARKGAGKFLVGAADKLPVVGPFDIATFILAIQNIKNVSGAFSECARVLVPNGKLVVVMNHPTFRIPKASEWGWDELRKVQYRRIERYLSEI